MCWFCFALDFAKYKIPRIFFALHKTNAASVCPRLRQIDSWHDVKYSPWCILGNLYYLFVILQHECGRLISREWKQKQHHPAAILLQHISNIICKYITVSFPTLLLLLWSTWASGSYYIIIDLNWIKDKVKIEQKSIIKRCIVGLQKFYTLCILALQMFCLCYWNFSLKSKLVVFNIKIDSYML